MVKYTIEYEARGLGLTRYDGRITLRMKTDSAEEIRQRAIRTIASRGAFPQSAIRITGIQKEG